MLLADAGEDGVVNELADGFAFGVDGIGVAETGEKGWLAVKFTSDDVKCLLR